MAENTQEIKVVVKGESDEATGAINRVDSAIDSVLGALESFSKKMLELLGRTEAESKKLQAQLAETKNAANVEREAESIEKLNKNIAETNRLEKERNEIKRSGSDLSSIANDAGESLLTVIKARLSGLIATLKAVKTSISGIMDALGAFGMAWQGIQLVVNGFKMLHEWMNRAARAAAEMRIASAFKDATEAMDRLISRQTLYNKLLKDELADLGRRKELRQIEESGKEQREKDRRDLARAKEIAGATDENEEREIRQRWAVEDETLERGKRYRQLKANVAEEEEKSAIYGSKARVTEENVAGVGADIDRLAAEKIRMNDEQRKEADKQIAALEAKRKALTEEAKQYRVEEEMAEKRAELYRRQIEDVRKSGGVAQVRNEVENLKINRQRQEDDRKFRAEVAKEDERRSQKLELEGMTDYQKYAELGNREYGAANRRRQAEERYAAETAKPTEERDEKRVAELREAVKTAQREEFEAADQKSAVGERIDEQTRNRGAEILGEAAGVQGNRLTAMGLGGGIDRENPKIESMMKDIISVLNNQLRATERLGDADHSAAFTE